MNATILRLSAQALFGRRRGLMMLVIPLILLVLTLVVRLLTEPGTAYTEIVGELGRDLALPLVALLAATAVLGPEIDDGSIVYLLAKPVNRYSVAVSKYVVALVAALGFGALPVLLAGLVNDSGNPGMSFAMLAGAVVAAFTYSGLFLALCAFTRHAVVAGLLFVFLWEGTIGNLLDGVRWLSVSAWARDIAAALSDSIDEAAPVGTTYALVAAILVAAGGIAFAGWRLSTFSLTGET
ncbi:ABC transporter permease [Nocardioides sp. InS609-2]|uniref:ABC transporter permease n=1 Tax=Nocardioides sp. InS609-2 TaxID=2760705 RepID=UPI0020C0C461|nr:ABC transporter permease [Nocardioides sp. InS609-2]